MINPLVKEFAGELGLYIRNGKIPNMDTIKRYDDYTINDVLEDLIKEIDNLLSQEKYQSQSTTPNINSMTFSKELEHLINKHCIENICDVPDFLLAEMISNYIESLSTIKRVLDWHGCDSVCHPKYQSPHSLGSKSDLLVRNVEGASPSGESKERASVSPEPPRKVKSGEVAEISAPSRPIFETDINELLDFIKLKGLAKEFVDFKFKYHKNKGNSPIQSRVEKSNTQVAPEVEVLAPSHGIHTLSPINIIDYGKVQALLHNITLMLSQIESVQTSEPLILLIDHFQEKLDFLTRKLSRIIKKDISGKKSGDTNE